MPFAFDVLGLEYYLIYQRFITATQSVGGTLLLIASGAKPGYPGD